MWCRENVVVPARNQPLSPKEEMLVDRIRVDGKMRRDFRMFLMQNQ